MIAYVTEATMSDGSRFPFAPLFNVATEDGRHFIDLTPNQLRQISEREGWDIRTDSDAD